MSDICEICKEQTDFIKEHHIHSKSKGGSNKPFNLAYICSECHDLVHVGIIIIEGRFSSMNGNILIWRKLNEQSITDLNDPVVWLKPNSKKIQEKYLQRLIVSQNNEKCN